MATFTPPPIGDPVKPHRVKVTSKEVLDFLHAKRMPLTKRTRTKARAKIRAKKERQALPKGRDLSFSGTDTPRQIIYGQVRTTGVISFLHQTDAKMNLHMVVTLAGHEIEEVTSYYVDQNTLTFDGSDISNDGTTPEGATVNYAGLIDREVNLGGDSQTAFSKLVSRLPSYWTSNHRQRGCAGLYFRHKWNKSVFAEGLPEWEFLVKGKKVYDPRTASTAYSNNAALCAANWLLDSRFGYGYSLADLDLSDQPGGLEWAADICDQNVSLKAGGTEKRYTANIYVDADHDKEQVLTNLESAMAGSVILIGDKWRFYPGAYLAPAVTFNEDDILSPVEVDTLMPKSDNFNAVRGTFVSALKGYEVTDFPPISIASEVTEDGGVKIYQDIALPATTSAPMAQRIAMIWLRRARESITFRATFSLKALQVKTGETIALSFARYGWVEKEFEVYDMDIYLSPKGCYIDLVLRETSEAIYDWDETQDENDFDEAPQTELPSPFIVEPPTDIEVTSGNATLEIATDGTVFARMRVAWTAPEDEYVIQGGQIQIQMRRTGISTWYDVAMIDGDQTEYFHVGTTQKVNYDVRIRAINALGTASPWVTQLAHYFLGKDAPPSNVSGLAATITDTGILLEWSAVTDLDLSHYEVWRGSAFGSGTRVTTGTKDNRFRDPYFGGSATYWVKAVDTSGHFSALSATVTAAPGPPAAVTNVLSQVIDNNILLRWTAANPGSFPVAYYEIFKGPEATEPNFLGRAYGTFFSYFTQQAEDATFWIRAIDIGGTAGPATSRDARISPPPDYVLRDTGSFTELDVVLTNAVSFDDGLCFMGPVDSSQTFEEHWTDFSQLTRQDFIALGYTHRMTPSYAGNTAIIEAEVDLGVILAGSRVTFNYETHDLAGACTYTPKIFYKEDLYDYWTETTGDTTVFASQFRYVKFIVEIDAPYDTDLGSVCNLEYQIDVKKESDSGKATSSASAPVTVNFNKDFLDVYSVQVTVRDDAAGYTPVVNFSDAPNPGSFEVLVFRNSDGVQVAKDFTWDAEGAVNP